MTTNAKLVLAALGVVALAATPAMAKTHHVQARHVQTPRVQVAPTGSESSVRYPEDYQYYDGYQSDRQKVGVGPGSSR